MEDKIDRNDELLHKYINNRDRETYEELFVSNTKLVNYFIFKYICPYSNKNQKEVYEEYFSVGCVGLVKAIKSFDEEKIGKVKFSTFAISCIKHEILAEIKKTSKFEQNIKILSLDSVVNEENPNSTLNNYLVDEDSNLEVILEEKWMREYKKDRINKSLDKLTENERSIIELYYGFNGHRMHTLREIGKIVGKSGAHIGNILAKAKYKLSKDLNEFKNEYRKIKK